MVPKRMEASAAALLPPGLPSSSDSSSSESLSEPQSSSSSSLGRRLEGKTPLIASLIPLTAPLTALLTAAAGAAAACVMRWNGLVETSAGGGDATGGATEGVEASEDWDIILKYGLRLSLSPLGLDVTI